MSKFDKKCSKCKNYNGNILICESCAHYKPKPTVFDHITQNMGTLAEELVDALYDRVACEYRYYSMLTAEFYDSRKEALAATVAELKKEWRDDT